MPVQVKPILPTDIGHYEIRLLADGAPDLGGRVDSQDLSRFDPASGFRTEAT